MEQQQQQHIEEESFEIIEKSELKLEDDESNNNNSSSSDTANVTINTTEAAASSSSATASASGSDEDLNDDNNNNQSKKYSRDELIKLKQGLTDSVPSVNSVVRNVLFKESSELDRILNRPAFTRGDAVNNMMPKFNSMTSRNSYQKQRSQTDNRRSQQGGGGGNRSQTILINLQSNEEVKLNEAENAWKPNAQVGGDADLTEEEKISAELLKQFRSILNKLTPENFVTLMQLLKVLKIDNIDRLDHCIKLVFEKAIAEPSYASNYAQMCKEVADVFVVPMDQNNSQQQAVFKKRLITQCQQEFEKHKNNELFKNTPERLQEIEDEQDPVKKHELKEIYDMENFMIRRRAVGTVHFIGELYKIEMLTSRIMRSCITYLLEPTLCSEETLECLCKLLTTIGKPLEKLDVKKVDLTDTFTTLAQIADKNHPIGISSRIRFMIQDLIDLRKNHWMPRRKESKPQTMDQIKQQVEMEQYISKMDNKESAERNGGGNRGGFQQGGNKRGGNIVGEDGWSTPSYSKNKPMKFDMNKIQLPATDEIKLGQGSNFFQNFGNRFSGLKEEETPTEQANRNTGYNGRFSAGGGGGNGGNGGGGQHNSNMQNNRSSFNHNNNNDRRGGGNGGNRNNNRSSAASRSLQPPNIPPQQQQNKQYGSSRNNNNSFNNNNANNLNNRYPNSNYFQRPPANDLPMKSNTLPRKMSAPARPTHQMENIQRPQDELNLITEPGVVVETYKKLLKSFMHDEVTMNDVIEQLQKYKTSKSVLVDVYSWIFDQHDKERFVITEIISEGVSRNLIMSIELLQALREIIDLAQDLVCDLPLVYRYIGQLLALPMLKRIVHSKDLLAISKTEIEANNGGTIVKEVFKIIEAKYEKLSLTQLYREAGIDFQLFLGDVKLEDFLRENNFEYLLLAEASAPQSQPQTPSPVLDEESRTNLLEKLKSHDVDAIILWVNNHIKNPTDSEFIRFMTESVLEQCIDKTIDGSYQVNDKKLEDLAAPVLCQFLDLKAEREIHSLYAIQRLINRLQHPNKMFSTILSCLFDNFAMSKTAILKWRDDNNPAEQEGKGVALKSCMQIIQVIKDENDEDSNDEN